jgi:hypothetical protein
MRLFIFNCEFLLAKIKSPGIFQGKLAVSKNLVTTYSLINFCFIDSPSAFLAARK